MYGRTFNLEAGQLVISITDLANRWDWARETVRKFLDRLETFKILSKSPLDRCSILTMNIEWLDSGYESVISAPASYLEMPKLQSDKMDK